MENPKAAARFEPVTALGFQLLYACGVTGPALAMPWADRVDLAKEMLGGCCNRVLLTAVAPQKEHTCRQHNFGANAAHR